MTDSTDERLRRLSERQEKRDEVRRTANIDSTATSGPSAATRERMHEQEREDADLSHKHTVRVLLGWITAFTGIMAAVTIINMIAGIAISV